MPDGSGCEILTDAAWAIWEPLIEEVRPRGKTPPKELRRTISALAAPERREVAQHPGGAWSVVAGGAAVHSLGEAGCLGAPARAGPAARHRAWHDFLDGTNIRAHHKAAGAQKRGSTAVSEMCARRLAALAAAMARKPA